ncbi:hypothetical protein ACC761_39565, partial [Rhizobium ruizarguesonis]
TAGSGFGISTTSKNKDAAWKAIQVLTSSEALSYLAEQGRALPARTASQSAWYKVAAKDITNGGKADQPVGGGNCARTGQVKLAGVVDVS